MWWRRGAAESGVSRGGRGRRPASISAIPGDIIGQRTAVNLQPPSLALFGAQHMRMLEATQARSPQSAPTMPAVPPAKPIIEKTEKTKQATATHLALLASLGNLGLSEHMLLLWLVADLRRQGPVREVERGRSEKGWCIRSVQGAHSSAEEVLRRC